MLSTQIWIVIKQSTKLELNEPFLVLKECENSHTLTTTTTGSKCSQKGANNQTDYQSHNALGPPKAFFTGSWSWMKSSARHTLSNQQAQVKQPETVNQIENAQRHFQGSLFGRLEYVLMLHLLLFAQSM